jgi:Uma2 family endonuclease
MEIALPSPDRPLRISADPALSRDEFWRFAAEYPNLRMEREPNGAVAVMTPTRRNTGSRNQYISTMLGVWTYADGRGDCFDSSTGFTLPDGSVLSPDSSWVALDRLKAAERDGEELPLVPDFVIELRSKTDSLADLRDKLQRWVDAGVSLAWLVDPSRKAVEIYRPGQQPEIQEGQTAVYGEGPVGGFVLELGRIWS